MECSREIKEDNVAYKLFYVICSVIVVTVFCIYQFDQGTKSNMDIVWTNIETSLALQNVSDVILDSDSDCTMEHFRANMAKTGFFPTQAIWKKKENPKVAYLESQICVLNQTLFKDTPTGITTCLIKKNIKKIVVLGDSNGKKMSGAVNGLLQKRAGFECKSIKAEQLADSPFKRDKYYYATGNVSADDIRTTISDCGGCGSYKRECAKIVNNKTVTVELEFLMFEFFIDIEYTTLRDRHVYKNCKYIQGNICVTSSTHQMFLFREYLAGNYPDLLIVATPQHDVNRYTRAEMKINIEYFVAILDVYLPKTTEVIWYTSTSTGTAKLPEALRKRTMENRTVLEQQDYMNHALYGALEDKLLTKNPRYFGFFDLFDLTFQIPDWRTDGAHFVPYFYNTIMATMLNVYCHD